MPTEQHVVLQTNLGHHFTNASLLRQALTHKSVGGQSNERLEFLGDSLVNGTVAEMLFLRFPQLAEGDLSRVRAALVCHDALTKVAKRIGVEPLLEVNQAYRVERSKDSILSDAVEAIFAAVYLDAGAEKCKTVILRHIELLLTLGEVDLGKDAKTALQEHLQARGLPVPVYEVISDGEPGNREFEVTCAIPKLGLSVRGSGKTRKAAEKDAAAKALIKSKAVRC